MGHRVIGGGLREQRRWSESGTVSIGKTFNCISVKKEEVKT